jgi:predicted Rossmann fold flavoprotein
MLKVIVVGGGPAGIMAAISASKKYEVILIERNKEIGAKLKLTGGGRCNITNNRDIEEFFDKIVSNKKFLYSALYTFSNLQLLEYFRENGLEYKEELDQKIYTKSDKADEVTEVLKSDLQRNNVKIMYKSKVQELIVEGGTIKGVVTDDGKRILGEKVIVTTGGKSYPASGSDGSMFEILSKFHTITPIYAALIPLVIKEEFVKSLQGVSMRDVVISAKIKKKSIEKFGDMIFTHFGISGPAVLKLSSYINKALVEGEVQVTLDFLRDTSKA